MKNFKFIFLTTFLFLAWNIQSQEIRRNREKIKELKIAFLTEKINLTIEEAKLFWPIYNEYEDSLANIRKEERGKIRKTIKKAGGLNNITDSDAERLVKEKLQLEKKFLQKRMELTKELSTILTYKKILKLHISEREFGRKLLSKFKRKTKY